MNAYPNPAGRNGSKRTEILLAVAITELLAVIVLLAVLVGRGPAELTTSTHTSRSAEEDMRSLRAQLAEQYGASQRMSYQGTANTNARALASAIQAKAITSGTYDANLSDYATDMGGVIPLNPCTGTTTGYTITTPTSTTATVAAMAGTNCGTWTPMTFNLTL